MNRNLMLIALFLGGALFPLAGFPPPQSPPSPEATEAVSDDTIIFLPMTIRSPLVSPPTPTPPTPTPPPTPTAPTPTLPPIGDAIVVDHTSLALFDQIPDQYLTAARNLRLMFSDRSVGGDINNALDCLAASSWETSPSYCRVDYNFTTADPDDYKTFTLTDLNNNTVPELIQFPAGSDYSRANWTFVYKQGTWSWLTGDFINSLAPSYLSSKDVLTYQFSYLNFGERPSIIDPTTGFFVNTSQYNDVHDLEAFIAQHPDKTFIFWTTSLARVIGTLESTQFNDAMRRYAIEHEKILFDVADLLSHDRNGQPCYDNIADGVNYPAICTDYTTEDVGGHLGSVSGGMITMAKAYWVLMARIAGWNP